MAIKAGSEEHKQLFCRQFIETHELIEGELLPWPDLDEVSLARLRGVPFWQEVYHTERRAGAIVDAFTPQVIDPLVREAVALQGVLRSRRAKLIRVLWRKIDGNHAHHGDRRRSAFRRCSSQSG